MEKWIREDCGCIGGLVAGGETPTECSNCYGQGFIWVSPKSRLALYPGGPFLGSEPGLYERLKKDE